MSRDLIAYNGGGEYVPPDFDPPVDPGAGGGTGGGTWASIANFVGAVTPWKVTNFAAKSPDIQDFGGTYDVITVTEFEIVLADPGDDNAAWAALGTDETTYYSPTLSTDGLRWVGPFILPMDDCESVIANFVCPQGLFRINKDGEPQTQSVSGLLEVTPIDEAGDPTGAATTYDVTLTNSPD